VWNSLNIHIRSAETFLTFKSRLILNCSRTVTTPNLPASSQHRAPDLLAIDIRALYKCILHYITWLVFQDNAGKQLHPNLTFLTALFTGSDMPAKIVGLLLARCPFCRHHWHIWVPVDVKPRLVGCKSVALTTEPRLRLNLGKQVPECLSILDSTAARGVCGDSVRCWKSFSLVTVASPTSAYQHERFTGRMSFLSPNQQCQSTWRLACRPSSSLEGHFLLFLSYWLHVC